VNDVSCPIPIPVVVLRDEPDVWAILFSPDTCAEVGPNPTDFMVWKLMGGSRNVGGLVGPAQTEKGSVPESATEESRLFVAEFSARRILSCKSGS